MKKRVLILITLLSFLLVLSSFAKSWAQIRCTSLLVARSSNNSLWANPCYQLSCSGWYLISGQFANQPTLTWDPELLRYVLVGVATNGNIWRSTFDAWCSHLDDWALVGGTTPSPVAAAGGPDVKAWARINADGTVASCWGCDSDPAWTYKLATGSYQVDFYWYSTDIRGKSRSAVLDTQGTGSTLGQISVADRDGNTEAVYVRTTDSAGTSADRPFTVIIY